VVKREKERSQTAIRSMFNENSPSRRFHFEHSDVSYGRQSSVVVQKHSTSNGRVSESPSKSVMFSQALLEIHSQASDEIVRERDIAHLDRGPLYTTAKKTGQRDDCINRKAG